MRLPSEVVKRQSSQLFGCAYVGDASEGWWKLSRMLDELVGAGHKTRIAKIFESCQGYVEGDAFVFEWIGRVDFVFAAVLRHVKPTENRPSANAEIKLCVH